MVDYEKIWLSAASDGITIEQSISEIKVLHEEFLSKIDKNIVIEIGINYGGSAKVWEALGFKEYIGIDNHLERASTVDFQFKTHLIKGDSLSIKTLDKVTNILDGREADFLFIDGGHGFYNAKFEYLNYGNFVRPGGVIAFHDIIFDTREYFRKEGEVTKGVGWAFDEVKRTNDTCQEIIFNTGIGVLFKQ